jgi:hypothetical protein
MSNVIQFDSVRQTAVPTAVKQFSLTLSGKFLDLYRNLRSARGNSPLAALVRDGLIVLSVLSSVDQSGKRPQVIVRFFDGNITREEPLSELITLETPEPLYHSTSSKKKDGSIPETKQQEEERLQN